MCSNGNATHRRIGHDDNQNPNLSIEQKLLKLGQWTVTATITKSHHNPNPNNIVVSQSNDREKHVNTTNWWIIAQRVSRLGFNFELERERKRKKVKGLWVEEKEGGNDWALKWKWRSTQGGNGVVRNKKERWTHKAETSSQERRRRGSRIHERSRWF